MVSTVLEKTWNPGKDLEFTSVLEKTWKKHKNGQKPGKDLEKKLKVSAKRYSRDPNLPNFAFSDDNFFTTITQK